MNGKSDNMKKLILIFALVISLQGFSGKVYVSSDSHGAKKVYITKNRSEANMFVYFVSDQNQANKPYLWYKVSDRNTANSIIHYVHDKNTADLIIYIVHDKNEARTSRKR